MPRPSIVGTPVGTLATASDSIDVTLTVPVGASALVVSFGGFAGGSAVTVVSVQDVTGTAFDINSASVYNQRGDLDQYSGKYVLYSPTPGSTTVRITISSPNRQLKACAYCLTDVDLAGTPINGSLVSGENAASIPSIILTSSSNALNVAAVASYSANIGTGGADDTLIYEEQGGGSASSLYVWHEDGTSSSDTVEGNASVAWSGVAISFEGTGGGASATITRQIMQYLN
jgi:hypothetical protein